MNKALGLLACALLLSIFACNKEKNPTFNTGAINLSFRATFGGETLVMNSQVYDYVGKQVRFTKISFYLANFRLINQDQELEVSDIEFIDITTTHLSETSAEKGTTIEFSNVPIGDYTGLKFGIGVPENLNETTPLDYPANHPLSAEVEYSKDWDSYIFAKIEGQYNEDGSGLFGEDDILFAYHPVMNRVFQEIELNNSKELKTDETMNINFELDVKQLLSIPRGNLFNLEPHNPNENIAENILIMANFNKALQLK